MNQSQHQQRNQPMEIEPSTNNNPQREQGNHPQNEQEQNNHDEHNQQVQAELLNDQIQMLQMNQNQYNVYLEDVEEHSRKIINRIQNQSKNQVDQQLKDVKPVKNPVSPYLMFVKRWKTDNPDKKFSIQQLGQQWKNLTPPQKREFVDLYKRQKQLFDIYQNTLLANNPNPQVPEIQNKYFFPLHRIKCIMKQDKNYTPKVQAVAAMARATQYFGQYFLQQMKKIKQGKNRVDTEDLFNCINNNQSIFGFLQCIIEQYAQSSKQITKQHKQKEQKSSKIENGPQQISQKKPKVMKAVQPRKKIIQKGQMNLMDMFSKK